MPESSGNVVGIKATGTIVDEDYKGLIPKFDTKIAEVGNLKVLLDITELEGYTAKAMLDDMNFYVKERDKMDKVAIVGDKKWEKELARICKPFAPKTMKYFEAPQMQEAWDWVKE